MEFLREYSAVNLVVKHCEHHTVTPKSSDHLVNA
jgi:hypothetical protein